MPSRQMVPSRIHSGCSILPMHLSWLPPPQLSRNGCVEFGHSVLHFFGSVTSDCCGFAQTIMGCKFLFRVCERNCSPASVPQVVSFAPPPWPDATDFGLNIRPRACQEVPSFCLSAAALPPSQTLGANDKKHRSTKTKNPFPAHCCERPPPRDSLIPRDAAESGSCCSVTATTLESALCLHNRNTVRAATDNKTALASSYLPHLVLVISWLIARDATR